MQKFKLHSSAVLAASPCYRSAAACALGSFKKQYFNF